MPATATRPRRKTKTSLIPAVAYYRMSTAQQDTSIEQQRTEVEKYAAEHGFKIIREYIDEGVSGDDTEKRFQFQQMMKDAKQGDFDTVLCWDQDRFGRFDSLEAGKWITPMLEDGVGLTTVGQGTIDFEDFAGRIVYAVNQEGKHNFLKDLSRNVCRKFKQMAEQGYLPSGCAAYGYDRAYIDEAGNEIMRVKRDEPSPIKSSRRIMVRLVPGDPDEVRIVKRIFREYAKKGVGANMIRDELNAEGVPTPRGAKHWTAGTIMQILSNQRYCGDMVYGTRRSGKHFYIGKQAPVKVDGRERRTRQTSKTKAAEDRIVVRDTHEALVDRSTFEMVQRKRAIKNKFPATRKDRPNYLLSGLLHCSHCGGKMSGRRKGERHFYLCDNYLRFGRASGCRLWSVHQDVFVDLVVRLVAGLLNSDEQIQLLREAVERKLNERAAIDPRRIDHKRRDLQKLESEYETAKTNVMAAPEGLRDELFAKLTEMKERREILEREIDELEGVDRSGNMAEQVDEVLGCFAELAEDHKRADPMRLGQLIRRVIRRVDLSFCVKPGTEKMHRQTFIIKEGTITLECPLPSSLIKHSSKKLNGRSNALMATMIDSFKNSCVCVLGFDSWKVSMVSPCFIPNAMAPFPML